jgi:hypothetical protein
LDSASKNGSGMALQEAFPDLPPLSPSPNKSLSIIFRF